MKYGAGVLRTHARASRVRHCGIQSNLIYLLGNGFNKDQGNIGAANLVALTPSAAVGMVIWRQGWARDKDVYCGGLSKR